MKNSIVNVRFSDLDYFMIKTVCDKMGVSVSDFVRSAVLRDVSIREDPVSLCSEFYSQRGLLDSNNT